MNDSLPVGSILAYAADALNSTTDQNTWRFCDGSLLSKTQYPDLFNAIGYDNGGTGDNFYLPDLRGRFIRGTDSASGLPAAGTGVAFMTKNPGFTATLQYIPNQGHAIYEGVGEGTRQMNRWHAGSDQSITFEVSGGDRETRPVNVYMNYVIKTTSNKSVPTGAVIPWTGKDWSVAPDPWELCSGNLYKSAKYPSLFKAIGRRYGSSSTSDFKLPMLSGIFIRGCNRDSQFGDPDVNNRTQAPDGSSGASVGTLQAYGTSAQGFELAFDNWPDTSSWDVYPVSTGFTNLWTHDRTSAWSLSGGDKESRPDNVNVSYYINSAASSSTDNFPIGGIIAIPGNSNPAPSSSYWLPADGRSLKRSDYSDLWSIFQPNPDDTTDTTSAWGNQDDQTFNLPNLNGKFLRATDLTDPGTTNPWGDPDRNNRKQSKTGGTTSGTGSSQDNATGRPINGFSINLDRAEDSQINAYSAGSDKQACEYNSNNVTVNFSQNDEPKPTETVPVHVMVNFWIKYAAIS